MDGVPGPVASIAETMSTFGGAWCLCGGWAVDAWLGRPTREHADVDIAVFEDELGDLFNHLRDWLLVAHDSRYEKASEHDWDAWDGGPLDLPAHIHGCPPGPAQPSRIRLPRILTVEMGFWLDIQVNERADGDWVFKRQPRISLGMEPSIRQSGWGLPTMAPEAIVFYKASDLRERDRLDFEALLPILSGDQRSWLRDAIAGAGHPWLGRLGPST